jgi:uncharacterized membrane protein
LRPENPVNRVPIVAHVLRFWSRLRSRYWFIPALIIAICVLLSRLMLWIDSQVPAGYVVRHAWLYTRDPNGARDLLSVVSQSMITVAGVVFSITVVTLTLATSQFGTRVLKSFARDAGSQMVLGTFLGTFLYGLLVMREVESAQVVFVPSLSVAMAIALATLSLMVLVYFIHHVIVQIQAENVVAAIAADFYNTMDVIFPEQLGVETAPGPERLSPEEDALLATPGMKLSSDREGFVRAIDVSRMLRQAEANDAVVRLSVMPGEFVREGTLLAEVWRQTQADTGWQRKLRRAVSIGAMRSYEDDIGFGVEQLGLIAVRSLSPAINAVGTALDAIERLIAGVVRLGQKKIPSPYCRDRGGRLRVIMRSWNFEPLFERVLDPIRHAATSNPTVIAHVLRGLAGAIPQIRNRDLRGIISRHMDRFAAVASEFPQESDRRRIHELYDTLREHRAA